MVVSGRPDRIASTFARLREAGEIGLFPYLTAGFPDRSTCAELLEVIASSGADGIEIGIPFSDPLADGVTLQRASARALEQGVSLGDGLALVSGLRRRHDLPAIIMTYVNPLLAYGVDRFCRDGAAVGLDGVIVADVPFDESASFRAACAAAGLSLVLMATPTSGPERLAAIGGAASGFVYCVTLVGTTGARTTLSAELPAFLTAARAAISAPLVAGFGISTPAHVAGLVSRVDGAIVASALADLIERTPRAGLRSEVARFVGELKAATRRRSAVVER